MKIKYAIETEGTESVLYSVVDTKFGGDAKNYVARGMPGYIYNLKLSLEKQQ